MAQQARLNSVMGVVNHTPRSVSFPVHSSGRHYFLSEIFGQNVFSLRELQKSMPKPVFARFMEQMRCCKSLDKTSADAIAHAVRVWAQERGATHFTHWFQPQTGATAEKHDSFLSFGGFTNGDGLLDVLDAFSGSQLLQSEPDASSFPSGGMRTTFEARGYTIWDTSSPMFIRQCGLNNTYTLYIPCVFISYNGEALDEKTILLRSQTALADRVSSLLTTIGSPSKRVFTTLGCEQEYFVIDRSLYSMRPDLKLTGRTLLGCVPPKHQQLEDHYFGKIPSRVLATMAESELELLRLGVPVKTRHNEVAPCQFELAPIFEEAAVAIDHNLLVMDVLHQVAHRNKLKVLFHEKPFAGVNGSGKHCNWSLCTEEGVNLLEPTSEPESNNRFLFSLLATLLGVSRHQGVLRCAISSASNDYRLGANEAPPSIMSAFLGNYLDEVLNAVEEGRSVKVPDPKDATITLNGKALNLKIATVPEIQRDLTDRNRTSPLAFTGNKFEFRAVGSRQSPSFPVAMLSAAASAGFAEAMTILQKHMAKEGTKADSVASENAQRGAIKELISMTKEIRFEGDNYKENWREEAKKRGLLIVPTTPDAYDQLIAPENFKMLTQASKVFTPAELHSRHHVLQERYSKDIMIEANTLCNLVAEQLLPCAFEYRKSLGDTIVAVKAAIGSSDAALPESRVLNFTTPIVTELQNCVDALRKIAQAVTKYTDPVAQAKFVNKEVVPLIHSTRKHCDLLEPLISDKCWPFPKYNEILFN